jgi:hypothetical protein
MNNSEEYDWSISSTSRSGSPEPSSASPRLPAMLHSMSEDSSSSESLLLPSEDDAASGSVSSVMSVLSPHEYPESSIIVCQNWSALAHPVRPCRPLAVDAKEHRSHFRFTFRDYRVVTVEKFIDGMFEYSFAYEYWPTGNIRSVVSTRARLGVLLEEFDEV